MGEASAMSRSDDDVRPYLRRRLRELAELRAEMARRSAGLPDAEPPSAADERTTETGQAADREPSTRGEDAT